MSDDLLASMGSGTETDAVHDLLSGLGEGSDASAWVPKKPGEGVQGTVLSRSTTESKFRNAEGGFTICPVVVISDATGEKVRVIGYASVLRKEIEECDPQPGDLFAAKYFGKKSTKDGSGEYHHYRAAARRGAGRSAGATAPF